jgi:hypothetical protein
MLESPWMLRYSLYDEDRVRECDPPESYGSDKSSAADNQQERLIKIGWIVGFVDGEGCFSIHIVRQPERATRKGYRTGFQVAHQFVVTQGAKSVGCLQMMQQYFNTDLEAIRFREVRNVYEDNRNESASHSAWAARNRGDHSNNESL